MNLDIIANVLQGIALIVLVTMLTKVSISFNPKYDKKD